MHLVGVAENKSNSLAPWSLYSNFMPLLPFPSSEYGYSVSSHISYFLLFLWNGFSGHLCEVGYQTHVSSSDVSVSVFLPVCCTSSTALIPRQQIHVPNRNHYLWSASFVFLSYEIASSLGKSLLSQSLLHQCPVRWHQAFRFFLALHVFSFRSFTEPSPVLYSEEDIRTLSYVIYLDFRKCCSF